MPFTDTGNLNRTAANTNRWILLGPALLLGLGVLFCTVSCVRQPPAASPESVATDFYRWYLAELNQHREPLGQETPALHRYVSTGLTNQIQRMRRSPDGLSEDYFLKVQDWPDDWANTVSANLISAMGDSATVVVTLGASTATIHRLTVRLQRQGPTWRISAVDPVP